MDAVGYEEIGPTDSPLVERSGRQPDGEVAPYLIDMVDEGAFSRLPAAEGRAAPGAVLTPGTRRDQAADEPDKLQGLHERGALTDVEFQSGKGRILA
jgi:hypothetical protein